MTIFEGSRYEEATIIRAKDASGEARPTVYAMVAGSPYQISYRNHILAEGERYDTLAYRLWGDPGLWWRIANLNPEHLYPAQIPPGTIVRVPAT